jgi:hypothetical protein
MVVVKVVKAAILLLLLWRLLRRQSVQSLYYYVSIAWCATSRNETERLFEKKMFGWCRGSSRMSRSDGRFGAVEKKNVAVFFFFFVARSLARAKAPNLRQN